MVLRFAVRVKFGGARSKLAVTVQASVIAPVVYVIPDKLPPQPLTLATKSEPGVTVKVVVPPWVTDLVDGEIVPPEPPPELETV